jgi:HEAT repeat protein
MTLALLSSALLVVITGAGFVALGIVHDALARFRQRRYLRAQEALADTVIGSEDLAAQAFPALTRLSTRLLMPALVALTTDLGGEATQRLRRIAEATGINHQVRRRSRRRWWRWRHRAQAAQLLCLLPPADPVRLRLLGDHHPVVRARAAETLGPEEALEVASELFGLLGDDNPGVRLAAQQALLRCDGRVIPTLAEFLSDPDAPGLVFGLEIAANLPDPRLDRHVLPYAGDDDPERRVMVAVALGNGLSKGHEADAVIEWLLTDDDPKVRVVAAEAAGRTGSPMLGPPLGTLLGDSVWEVRRAAGQALAQLGPVGRLVLRVHLHDEDRFARDMARQIIDIIDPAHAVAARAAAALSEELDDFPADASTIDLVGGAV